VYPAAGYRRKDSCIAQTGPPGHLSNVVWPKVGEVLFTVLPLRPGSQAIQEIRTCRPVQADSLGGLYRRAQKAGASKGPQPLSITPRSALALLTFSGLLGFPGATLGRLYTSLPPGEHRVHEVHVGIHRLPGEGPRSIRLALLLLS
jgi:hypothetical protein